VTGLAALGVLSLAFLPSEHLHVTRTHDGHHSDVVHRHYTPHAPHHPVAGTTARVGDDDDQPRWLDSPFTSPRSAAPVHPGNQVLLNQNRPVAPAPLTRLPAVTFVHPSVHDPPLKTPPGLRGPPASPSDLI